MKKTRTILWLTLVVLGGALLVGTGSPSFAGNWGIDISPGGWGFHYGSGRGYISVYSGPPYYPPAPAPVYVPAPYYPVYNPVVRRDVVGGGYYAPDGTFHSENRVEDRHSSYYSPGRNQAITPPRTTVRRIYGPYGTVNTQERTTWIGADGLPHSTTIDRTTSQDIWGNTHTDTHVTLKEKKPAGEAPKLLPKKEPPKNQPQPEKK